MPADPNWSRWIFASIADYLKSTAADNNITAFVEGLDERDDAFMSAPERAEFRVNGPFSQEVSNDCFRVWVDVNVLLTSQLGGSRKNAYDSEVNLGIFQNALDQSIPIFKYGSGAGDDQSQIGCLSPRTGAGDSIEVRRFGQTQPADRVKQEMVSARYYTYLSP